MRHYILNVKSLMFLFAMILLVYGTQGISYGQVCGVGDRIAPGESCTYPGTDIEFSVFNNGSGRFLFFTAGTAINARNVTINGVQYNFAASKQADGTWLIEAAGDGSTPPAVSKPDLVVEQPTVSPSTLAPGERFTLSATVANNGAGSAAATTLRYYRSTNATITTRDTEVGKDSVSALGANQSSAESITLTAPSSPGTYYYGACVEAVTGESSSDNNCSAAVSVTVRQVVAPSVAIPDANLRAAIETALGRASDDTITTADMAKLTELSAGNSNINDLTGLEHATNLTSLWLSENSISDLSPVAGLTQLTSVDLGGNNISDLSAMAGLTNLTYLDLYYNSISDISTVARLTNLTYLSFQDNLVSNISPLARLTNLIGLILSENSVSNISPLAGLTQLTYLSLGYNNISDLSPLVANTGLGNGDRVDVSGNPLNYATINTHIPTLQNRGVEVRFENLKPPGQTTPSVGEDIPTLPMVRVIYFLPNDRQPLQDIDTKLDTLIKDVQKFYANEMERHGFGRKTFKLETDVGGKTVVHHVNGQYAATYYNPLDTVLVDEPDPFGKVVTEIDEQFGPSQTIYLIAADITSASSYWRGGGQAYLGGHTILYIPFEDPNESGQVFISFYHTGHELAHSFGLQHDFRYRSNIGEADITSYQVGVDPNNRRLSRCAAEWLDVHPYFNPPNQTSLNGPTTLQMLSPLAYPPNAINLRFMVTDPDGLHQVQLLIPREDGFSLNGCKSLNGETSTTIEFITTELTASRNEVALGVIDVHGNFRWESYTVQMDGIDQVDGVIHIENLAPETLRKISGDHQGSYLNSRLTDPFVVMVRDAYDEPVPGVQVMFQVISGEGHLSVTDPWTDSDGQAQSFLTLGSLPGEYRVAASVSGVSRQLTFSAAVVNTTIVPGTPQKTLVGHTDEITSVVYSPDGRTLASGSYDYTIRLWDSTTGSHLRTLTGHTGSVESLAFSPDGTTLASGSSDDTVRLWDTLTGRHKLTFHGRSYAILSVAYSPDGETLATGTLTGEIHLWDATTGQHKKTLTGHRRDPVSNIRPIAFRPDGLTLITGGTDGTVRLWDVVTGQQLKIISVPLDTPQSQMDGGFAFSPDGGKIANFRGWELTIGLWDATTGQHEKTLTGHTSGVSAGAFSPNGRLLATGSVDSEIRLWNAATGALLKVLIGHTRVITDLVFSPDGTTLASGSTDGNVLLWDLAPISESLQRTPQPDLVLEAVQAVPATVAPGEKFRLYATLKNQGTAQSAATTVRYYRSTDNVISTTDTQLGTGNRNPLASNDTIRRYLSVTAPTTPGTYYYGVCVDSVANESNTGNNCSAAVSITVPGGPVVSTPSHPFIYWTDYGADKIQRANLDGSNIVDLVTQGLESPDGIALDVAGGKMYWADWGTNKIQRANLDGSNIQDLVTQGLSSPNSIALDVVGGKMYWTGTDKIQRANLDGSNVQALVTQGLIGPRGIALDVAGGKMYWTDNGTDKIQRANLDGSNVQDLVTRGLEGTNGIALDVAGGKMYWTDTGTGKIQRANLDGSNVQDLVTRGLTSPIHIALDVTGGKMYWTDVGYSDRFGAEKIQRANLDGSNVQDLVTRTQGLHSPLGIAVGITSQALPPLVREDVNRDRVVNVQDIVYVAQRYGQTGQNQADVNGDGVVNIDDIILVAAVVDSTPAAPSIRSQLPKDLTATTVDQWVTEARLTGKKTPRYQRGILVLEQLLAALTPKETVLLANYPNPFNPETWIPYRLANDTDVSLFIYDINGALVRELDLGHQRAGYYTDRSRAAYWDGRNGLGERVASGVYFYQLRAGDYLQMRKMVILK